MLMDFVGTGTEDRAVSRIIFYRGEGNSRSESEGGVLAEGAASPIPTS